MKFFTLADLNVRISALIEDLNTRTMLRDGKSRRDLFDEVERIELKQLPSAPFEYAEWKIAKVHPDYHIERRQDLLFRAAWADRKARRCQADVSGG